MMPAPRPMRQAAIIPTSGTKTAIISASCQPGGPSPPASAAKKDCAPTAVEPTPAASAMMRSMRVRVKLPRSGALSRDCGMRPQAASSTSRSVSVDTSRTPLRPLQDAVLHRPPEQVDLRGRRAADLDVLDAHAGDVLLGRGVGDSEPVRDDLQGKPCRIEPQHFAL